MSAFQSEPTWLQSGLKGQAPAMWFGVNPIDGDAEPFSRVPIGSLYAYKPDELTPVRYYEKRAMENRDDDWGTLGGIHVLQQRVEYSDFTDGGSTTGTFALTEKIPVGAFVVRSLLVDVDDFVGATTATIQVGDGSDVDRYNTGTPSLATSVNALDLGAVSGTAIHASEATVTLTVTEDSDFGDITAGGFTIRIYYYL